VEQRGQSDIISFFPHGKAFIVHQPKRFVGTCDTIFVLDCCRVSKTANPLFSLPSRCNYLVDLEEIMPKYFSTSRMSSFQRQLNLYGFQRIDDGPEKGGFVHQYFQQGQRSLCNKINRHRSRTQGSQQQELGLSPTQATGAAGVVPTQMQRAQGLPGGGTSSSSSAVASQASMPQSQQAQVLLQYLLNQQQQHQQPEHPNLNDGPRRDQLP
jgi:HSF-type DNA-binding